MTFKRRNPFVGIMVLFFSIFTVNAAESDISQLQQQCNNITKQQREMAKAAGYDIDSICSSFQNYSAPEKEETKTRQSIISRDDTVELDERGVIINAQGQEQSTQSLMYRQGQYLDQQPNSQFPQYPSPYPFYFPQPMLEEGEDDSEEEQELKPYGYELFAGLPTTFAPAEDIAIPSDYVLGANDILNVQLIGNVSESYELAIGRDGAIQFPELGPISLTGLSFPDAKALIQQRVSDKMLGVRAIISLGEIRSIRVFVLGEAFKPGSYTVSALSTMTNAIFVSGGITDIGSLRNIELKRAGETVTKLDLYDLLQKGDTSGDKRLQPGDVIYIPTVGKTVSIDGEVKRPGIYEIKNEKSLSESIQLAGGVSSRAYSDIVSVTRNNNSGFTSVIDYDLKTTAGQRYTPVNGDVIHVPAIIEDHKDVVYLSGEFHRDRAVKWYDGIKVSNVIQSASEFTDDADLNVGVILRKEMPLMETSVLTFDLNNVLLGKSPEDDLTLMPLDEIFVFNMEDDRAVLLEKLVEKITRQTSSGNLVQTVQISGNIRFPGEYPLGKGMNIKQLIAFAGGLKEATYLGRAEITRREITSSAEATVNHINIELENILLNGEDFKLKPRDKLSIYVTPEYQEQLSVTVTGEVRFPGNYQFKRGETLSQVIARAGGFSELAHLEASVFTRTDLKIKEAKQLKELQEQLEKEVAASELQDQSAGENSSGLKGANELLTALEDTDALGRLVIKLRAIVDGTEDDILLKDGDTLVVPPYQQEVSVVGEVQKGSSHMFNEEWLIEDYIEGSGGFTERADTDRIYVVRADGSVFLPNQGGWLSHQNELISAGDTIVIPLEADKIKQLTLWTNVSQIVYQIALGVASIKSL